MKDHYVFPAILSEHDNQIFIEFPNFPSNTLACPNDYGKAIQQATEKLGKIIIDMEVAGETIPEPYPLDKVNVWANHALVMIEIFMPLYRQDYINTYVKKTLTIPSWLNEIGIQKNVNFSKILADALIDKMGIGYGLNNKPNVGRKRGF